VTNTKPVIVGSHALQYLNPDFKIRDGSDFDVIAPDSLALPNIRRLDRSDISFLNNKTLAENYLSDIEVTIDGVTFSVLNLKGLYILKRSHLHRPYFFQKHMFMFNKYLRAVRDSLDSFDLQVLRERKKLTYQEFNISHPVLDISKKDFFADNVNKVYDHDWLHTLFAHKEKPMYQYMLKDGHEVMCDKSKWNQFSFQDKVNTVLEECYVIAFERFIATNLLPISGSHVAFSKALEKVCTTLTSGWFRDFALDNFEEINKSYDLKKISNIFNYIETLKTESAHSVIYHID